MPEEPTARGPSTLQPADQQPRPDVQDDGDDQEQDRELVERREPEPGQRIQEAVDEPARNRRPLGEQRRGRLVDVVDDEGDRDRLANRAAEPEDRRAGDAGGRRTEDREAGRLPAGRPQAPRSLAKLLRDGAERLPRQRGDRRDDHDREDERRGEDVHPPGAAGERAGSAGQAGQGRLHRGPQQRHQDGDGPEPVDNTRDRRAQVHEVAERAPQPARRHLRGEQGNAEADREGEREGEETGDERAGDRRPRAERAVGLVAPGRAPQEAEPEVGNRRPRVDYEERGEGDGEADQPDGEEAGADREDDVQAPEEAEPVPPKRGGRRGR